MFVMLVGCSVFVTGVLLYRARDAFYYGERRKFWRFIVLGVPMIAVSGMAFWLMLHDTQLSLMKPPNPLGPGWDCETYGRAGATVCFKH
jgi:hypothetical protein